MGWSPNTDVLRGRVVVVAGATRGAGRGIAAALGEVGATVICTGRSTRSRRSDYNRAETIEETAELVTRLGGIGIAGAVDHLDPDQVKSLAEQIRNDHGHIDVLVNDIWGGELLKGGRHHAGMASLRDDARQFRRAGGELARRHRRSTFVKDRPSAPADFAVSESPRYVGRAVVALACDSGRARGNQSSVTSGQLALEYGFTDLDGTQPDIWRYIEEVREAGVEADPSDYR